MQGEAVRLKKTGDRAAAISKLKQAKLVEEGKEGDDTEGLSIDVSVPSQTRPARCATPTP